MAEPGRGSSRLRVAMVGAGSMANRVHYPSLAGFDDVTIEGICDIDRARLDATADRYGIEGRYVDYRQMVEQVAPDAVYVIGQPHIMYDIWTWCLRHGLNLFVEKPPGITLHQARALAALAEAHGCLTQVGFQRRSSPMYRRMREACLERGPVTMAVCTFYKCAPEPYLEARDHMMDDGVHAIDTLRWACGGEVVHVDASLRRVGVPDVNMICALLHFDNGATGVLLNNWSSGRRTFFLEIHASGICAEGEHEGQGHIFADGDVKGVELDAKEEAGSDEFHIYGGFAAKSREFLDAVKTGTQPSSCFGDAVKTMEVAERVLSEGRLDGDSGGV
jgi:virulence factor